MHQVRDLFELNVKLRCQKFNLFMPSFIIFLYWNAWRWPEKGPKYVAHMQGAINPLNAKLNPISRSLALLGAHAILHISSIKVNVHISTLWGR